MSEKTCSRKMFITCDFLDDKIVINDGSFAGRNYYIVPAVMLVEGAFTPAVDSFSTPSALFFDGKDIQMSVQSWNGRPVSLYHPIGNTSCNIPHVLDGQLLGYVFGVRFDQDGSKLRADLWLDKERGEPIIDRINRGDKIDLSVGAYGDIVYETGTHGGVEYTQRMTNIVGDHLAVLPDAQGACNWEDGCGIRMSKGEDINLSLRELSYSCSDNTNQEDIDKNTRKKIKAYYAQIKDHEKEIYPEAEDEILISENGHTEKETKMEKESVKVEVKACDDARKKETKEAVTMNDVLATAPKELRGAIADAMREREEQRKSLVSAINGYEKVDFCPNFLDKIDTKELKAIASLVAEASKEKVVERKVDYSLQSGIEVQNKQRCEAPSIF